MVHVGVMCRAMNHTSKLISVVALFLFASCGGPMKYQLEGISPAEGADGQVEIEKTEAGNHRVSVEVMHLLPPKRIEAKLATYCVWFAPVGKEVRLAGILAYDNDKRKGSFETSTPYGNFDLIVTAEQVETPTFPSSVVVMKQRVSSGS